jgi:hypothetical protein
MYWQSSESENATGDRPPQRIAVEAEGLLQTVMEAKKVDDRRDHVFLDRRTGIAEERGDAEAGFLHLNLYLCAGGSSGRRRLPDLPCCTAT